MAQESFIAQAIKAKRANRKSKAKKEVHNHDTFCFEPSDSFTLGLPANYPSTKFRIESVHEITFSNDKNYTVTGVGSQARWSIILYGSEEHFKQNLLQLLQYYQEYPWKQKILPLYRGTKCEKVVQKLEQEIELQSSPPGTVLRQGVALLVVATEQDENAFGRLRVHIFSHTQFVQSKQFEAAKSAATTQVPSLEVQSVLAADDQQYLVKLENICLRLCLDSSNQLASVLSKKDVDTTQNVINILCDLLKRRLCKRRIEKFGNPVEVDIPWKVAWGPSGVVAVIASSVDREWAIAQNEKFKVYSLQLSSQDCENVWGSEQCILDKKTGKYWLQSLNLNIRLKMSKNEVVEQDKCV